jgi:uncharacterized protein (DUF697 family)
MQIAGLGIRDIVRMVGDARSAAESSKPLVVTGVLAAELVRALTAGGEAGAAVRVGGDPTGAAGLIVVLAGSPTEADDSAFRSASRASVPILAVQTDARVDVSLPYVLPSAVIVCQPGQGFPVKQIVDVLGEQLGHDAVAIAARVPALRETVSRELVRTAALRAAVLGALPWRKGADLPVLTLLQARLVLDLALVYGHEVGQERAPELAAVAGTGLGLRGLVRRLPYRLPLIGGVTGYLATRALGEAAIARYSAAS